MDKYKNQYVKLIKDNNNKVPDHKMYEYLYAIKLNLIHWDDIPPTFCETYES